ncbi:MAG: thiazole synthase, partial [Frankiales bacterium]|nr:thiazole synthase [Frankiales bacterium]
MSTDQFQLAGHTFGSRSLLGTGGGAGMGVL